MARKIFFLVLLVVVSVFLVSCVSTPTGGAVGNSPSQETATQQRTESTPSPREPTCRDVQVPYEDQEAYQEQEEYLKTEYYTETVPYTDRECETQKIPYSVTNEGWKLSRCNDYNTICREEGFFGCRDEEEFCVDKTVSYGLDINNLDREERGVWQVGLRFVDLSAETIIRENIITKTIYPQSSEPFIYTVRLISDSPSGEANNNNIGGIGFVVTEPTKQVCRDVTKYKEVERSRQVTDYRPVTKYRTVTKYKTETQCE